MKHCVLAILVFISTHAFAQIPSGTYTIGGSSPDYADFTTAITDLNTNGLVGNGPVNFNVRTGTYTEQVVINQIANATAVNTITFQSESGDSSDVTLTYALAVFADNYTLKLDGADYITVQNMTITATNNSNNRVVVLTNGAKFNRFISNKLMTISGSNGDEVVFSDDATSNDDDNTFEGNWILNGSSGLEFEGTSGARKKRVIIRNNLFETYRYAIYMRYTQDVEISGNRMINASSSNGPATQGVYCFACDSMLTITKNTIVMMDGTNNYGLELLTCKTPYGGYRGIIANNMITVGGTGTSRGVYTNGTTNKDFFNNSILTTGTNNTSSVAFYLNGPSSGTPSLNANFVLRNNIFMADNGYAVINSVGGVIGSDHNDYMSIGAVSGGRGQLGEWITAINNLTELMALSLDDANSVRVDPLFILPTDLHINTGSPVISAGEVLAAVTDDIDDETRDSSPDIGADEFGCIPLIVFIGSNATICSGDSVVLDAGAGYTSYLWSDASIGQTLTVDTTGTYSVTVTDTNGCSGNDAITITVETPPTGNITVLGANGFCVGDSTELQSDAATNYSWLLNGSTLGPTSQNTYVADSGSYQVLVSSGGGCTDTSAAVSIAIFPLPLINSGSLTIDSSSCGNSDGNVLGLLVAGGTPSYTYAWLNSLLATVGGDSADLANVPAESYTLSVTDSNGCSAASGPHTVFDQGAPSAPTASSPTPYCNGDIIVDLTASGSGGTLYWLSDSALTDTLGTGGTYSPNPNVSDTFYVAEGGVCPGPATQVILTINPMPTANITPQGPTTFCAGDSVELQAASVDSSYLWFMDGSSIALSAQNIYASQTGDYQTIVTNSFGCVDTSSSITITVNSASSIVIPADTNICPGDTIVLTASGGSTYTWDTGDTTTTISISPDSTTTFYITVLDTGCSISVTDSVLVVVNTIPTIEIGVDSISILLGESANLTVTGGLTYIWNPATDLDDPFSPNPVASPTVTTVYSVIGDDANGCSNGDTVVVEVTNEPTTPIVEDLVIFIPNFITPNGDNQNDLVYVAGGGVASLVFVIYDRWGEKIFETEGWGESFAWDGSYQGEIMDAQVFVYYVIGEYTNGDKISEKGNITLYH